jgi:hypothetical protein
MGSTTDLALHDVFYAERRPDGSELLACGGKGQEIACQFMPTIAGVAERLGPCRLGAAVRILRIEQVVANLFGCGGRLGCIWDWYRDGKRQNGSNQRLATTGLSTPPGFIASPLYRVVRQALPSTSAISPQPALGEDGISASDLSQGHETPGEKRPSQLLTPSRLLA